MSSRAGDTSDVVVEGPVRREASFGVYWTAKLRWPDGLVHDVSSESEDGVRRLIARLLEGDPPGGV